MNAIQRFQNYQSLLETMLGKAHGKQTRKSAALTSFQQRQTALDACTSGDFSLRYTPSELTFTPPDWSKAKFDNRTRELNAVYNEEMSWPYDKYGAKSVGHISISKIESDLAAEKEQAAAGKGTKVDIGA